MKRKLMEPGRAVALAVVALSAAATLAAPARAQEQADRPIAPELSGLGSLDMPVTTAVPRAQAFFNQGVRLLYAFNHQEARRAFEEAARLDPDLAMAYWGQAMTWSPNLNAPLTAEQARRALEALDAARRVRPQAAPREQGLIDALAARFSTDAATSRKELDQAYAAAMARVAAAYPGDPDIQTFYADAVMNTMPWDYWQKDGALKPEAARTAAVLEQVIEAHPDHPGAHHYYIHLLEGGGTPERAEASADRLGSLMPAAGHMVHMPAHIYLRLGRYADAAEANVRAIAADEDYLAQCQAQGLYPVSYYPHNLHFLWAAATFEGRGQVAIDAARDVASKVPHHHAGALAWTADFPVTPWLAYVRFGRWKEMLTEPAPPETEPYAMGIWHYGRGLAFIARNQLDRAEAELTALTELKGHEAFRTTLRDLPLLTNLEIASRVVAGELAGRRGRYDEAIDLLTEAVSLEDAIPYNEPPVWHQSPRLVLGALLLEAGRPAAAETAYREDLQRFRENGWALFGLWRSLEAQARAGEARTVRQRFEKAWARADVSLASSRILDDAPASTASAATAPARPDIAVKVATLPTGVRLQYAEQGEASGTPVVFLHGVTDSWRSFEPLLAYMPRTIRAIAVSQRGHGESSRPADGYRYADMSEDLNAFMDVLGLQTAVIVGHSMGASVAQRFAIDHSERVSRLVLMASYATLHGHAGIQEFWTTTVSALTDPIDPAIARGFQTSTLARPIAPDMLDVFVGESLKVPARVWKAAFKGFLETPDFSHELAHVTAPTLIVGGERDSLAGRRDQERLKAAIPGARLVTYEGAGHGFHWEDPARFARDLVAFLGQGS